MTFRCSAASESRSETLAGTASTVRAFLLLEDAGPWGVDALRDARLPDGLGEELGARAAASRVRVLLVRRPGRSRRAEGWRVFGAHAHHARPWMETTTLQDLHGVHDLDIEALGAGRSMGLTPHPEPILAVCTHGRHDTCCAERGRPVAAALAAAYPDQTWETSHIGGDRFAANMVVLPHGLYYGRLDEASARAVADAQAAGRLELDHLRGRSGMATPLQAAEIALRRRLGESALDGVRFVSRTVDGARTRAVFAAGAERYVLDVVSTRSSEQHLLTCKALRENPVVEHAVVGLRLEEPA